jgi:hypothetical protein
VIPPALAAELHDAAELTGAGVDHGLPSRVIAEQMGWELAGTLKLLRVDGHGDVGALEEVDRAFGSNVRPLRAVGD